MTNPLIQVYEIWLTFFNALPLGIRAFFNLSWALFVVVCLISILFRSKH